MVYVFILVLFCRFLNLVLSFLLVWPFNLLGVTMAVEDFGFLRVQGLYIGWKNNKNMSLVSIYCFVVLTELLDQNFHTLYFYVHLHYL